MGWEVGVIDIHYLDCGEGFTCVCVRVHIYVKTSNCLNVCSLLYVIIHNCFPGGSAVKNTPAMQETRVQTLGQENPLEKEMATHSSVLAWRTQRSLVSYSPWGLKEQDVTM